MTASSAERASIDSIACRICGSANGTRFIANKYTWLKCARCLSIQKRLTFAEYQSLNPTYDPGLYLDSRDRKQIEVFLQLADKVRVIDEISEKYLQTTSRPRTFLDVGCGMGGYLLAAQQLEFQIVGIEPSAEHARAARDILKLPVIGDYFSPAAVENRLFDFIMLSHVIEHVFMPADFLRTLISALKPGGVLVVVTPNSQSLVARLLGKNWPMLKPVDHVSMICADTYEHFDIADLVDVHHSWSEYPWEFAATVLSSSRELLRASLGGRRSSAGKGPALTVATPSVLRDTGIWEKALKLILTALSWPFHYLAVSMGREACLISVLVRKR